MRAAPSRRSESTVQKNRIKVAQINDLCSEKEILTEKNK